MKKYTKAEQVQVVQKDDIEKPAGEKPKLASIKSK